MTNVATAAARSRLLSAARNAGIAVIVVYCLAPFFWMVVSAFRRPTDQFQISLLPRPWSTANLRAVFEPSVGFQRALLNSLVVAGTTTALTLLIGTVAAYALARLDFPFKNAAAIIVATSMFPGISLVVPPLVLAVLVFQRRIVAGLTAGGVK